DEGRKKMEKAAKGMCALELNPDIILTSPLVRAAATAKIAAAAMSEPPRIVLSDALRPGTSPQTLFSELHRYRGHNRFLLVGHEPDLSSLAATLLGVPDLSIKFKKGGLCHIEVNRVPPAEPGTLSWHLTPEQLRLLGR